MFRINKITANLSKYKFHLITAVNNTTCAWIYSYFQRRSDVIERMKCFQEDIFNTECAELQPQTQYIPAASRLSR